MKRDDDGFQARYAILERGKDGSWRVYDWYRSRVAAEDNALELHHVKLTHGPKWKAYAVADVMATMGEEGRGPRI